VDVPADSWYAGYAAQMAQSGFMGGHADGRFGGEEQVTRAQFAVIMARMLGLTGGANTPYPDLDGHWAAPLVARMVEQGLIQGRADGTFGPDLPVTRAQMAAIMDRAWDRYHEHHNLSEAEWQQLRGRLHDLDGHWAADHIAHMHELGVVQGDQHGQFRPEERATRAQASAMLWRWHDHHQSS